MAAEVAHEITGLPPARSYYGLWALETLGGAGGQTIGGVVSTATHGGDVVSGAIGDMVVALHLIGPDAQEYWIERKTIHPSFSQLVDPLKLANVYSKGAGKPGGVERVNPIQYIQSDDLVNAAIVACGRMGVIYSMLLRTIRQYALDEVCETEDWSSVKKWICNPLDPKFASVFINNHFVRIDVDVYPVSPASRLVCNLASHTAARE